MGKSNLSPLAERLLKGVLVRPNSKLIRRAAGNRPAKTALRAMMRDIDRAANGVGPDGFEGFANEIMSLLRNAPAASLDAIKPTEPTTEMEVALCDHFDRLEQRLPLATIMLIGRIGPAALGRLETIYNTTRLATELSRARGERKLELLRPFALHVLENEYGPFLHVLLQADCAAAGRTFPDKDTVGALVHDARKREVLGKKLWFDAGKVRNAAAHRESWDYDIDKRVVRLRDETRIPPWRATYDAADLLTRLLLAVSDRHALNFVLSRSFERGFVATLGPVFMEFIRSGDKNPLEAAYKPMEARLLRTHAELMRLGWKPLADTEAVEPRLSSRQFHKKHLPSL